MSINTFSIVMVPINVFYLQFNIVVAHIWGLNGGHNLILPSKGLPTIHPRADAIRDANSYGI